MENKKILDLTPEEVEFFAALYDIAYISARYDYLKAYDFDRLEKLKKLSEKIDIYIANNI